MTDSLHRAAHRRMTDRPRLTRLFDVLWRAQTYLNIAYLLAAFPLGLTYFIVLVVGVSVSISTALVGVGLLLLPVMLGFSWAMAAVERRLVRTLLRVDIAPPAYPRLAYRSPWARLKAYLRQPMTWKGLVYLLVEFPFGVVSFCVTIALLSLSAVLVLDPLVYLVDAAPYAGRTSYYLLVGVRAIDYAVPGPARFYALFALFLLTSSLGVLVTLGSLHALNGIARAWGLFARLMLGMGAMDRRLAEARAATVREQARAERADQRRRELIVNVSHELRTPIANIRGHVESLRLPLGARLSETERQSYLAIVAREAERLGALVDDLLALARAEADELRLEARPVAVGAVVEEVYGALAPLAQRDRQVTLVRTVAPGLPPVLADRDRLAQVLLNLARNAITATPPGGLVFVDAERAGVAHVALIVSDTGHGMSQEDLGRVFDRFYRADASRARATGGFGLGLSIVHDLVHAMGGTITATSTPGAGSCFRVTLPLAPTNG